MNPTIWIVVWFTFSNYGSAGRGNDCTIQPRERVFFSKEEAQKEFDYRKGHNWIPEACMVISEYNKSPHIYEAREIPVEEK